MTAESEIDPSGPLRVRVSSHLSATVQESKVVMPTVNYGLRLCRRTRGRPGSAVASWLRCEDEGAAAVRPPSSVVCTVCVVLAHALLPDFIRSVLTPWSPFPAALAHLHSADRGQRQGLGKRFPPRATVLEVVSPVSQGQITGAQIIVHLAEMVA